MLLFSRLYALIMSGPSYVAYEYYKMVISAVNGGTLVSGADITLIDENDVDQAIHTATPGTATSSSGLSGWGTNAHWLYEVMSQDGDTTNGAAGWITNNVSTGWNQWYLDVAEDLVSMIMVETQATSRNAKDFTIQWSDDGSSWNTVLTVVGENRWGVVPGGVKLTYNWPSEGAHRYWKIDVTANNGDSYLAIRAMHYINAAGTVITGHTRRSHISANTYWAQTLRPHNMIGQPGVGWVNAAGTTETVRIHTGIPIKLKSLSWEPRSGETDRCPKDFEVWGSNDGINWELLLTVEGETSWTGTTPISFDMVPWVPIPPGDFMSNWSFTGENEDFLIGANIDSLNFALGGGAGGAGQTTYGTQANSKSGSGGFVSGSFDVVEGDLITIQIGNGGEGGSSNDGTRGGRDAWPDGGLGADGDTRTGAGGGSTRIWKNGDLMAVASGGGGAAGYSSGGSAGAGGGTTGQGDTGSGGEGGTPTSGGRDSSDTGNVNKTGVNIVSMDPARTGGWGSGSANPLVYTSDDGGGGGGGWWGGGGGGGDGRSGGGGSSMTVAEIDNVINSGGNIQTPHSNMTTHPEYPAGASVGQPSVYSGDAPRGGPGWGWLELVDRVLIPINYAAPTIAEDDFIIGSTITVTAGDWIQEDSIAYQWLRDGVDISGATGMTYVTVSADLGKEISVKETATNTYGSDFSISDTILAGGTPVSVAQVEVYTILGAPQTVVSAQQVEVYVVLGAPQTALSAREVEMYTIVEV